MEFNRHILMDEIEIAEIVRYSSASGEFLRGEMSSYNVVENLAQHSITMDLLDLFHQGCSLVRVVQRSGVGPNGQRRITVWVELRAA